MGNKAKNSRTKLLLLLDVDDLGRSGEVVGVKPGYARNYLLPEGFATIADKYTLRMQAKLQAERAKQAIEDKKDSEALAKTLEGITLSTVVKVDQEGHMFGSVSQLDIMKLLKDEKQIEITKKMVVLPRPIKETGVHTIHLKLKEEVKAEFTLKVMPDREIEAPIPEEIVKPIEQAESSAPSEEVES